ncbi:MAG: hypothetical protein M1823_002303 [Watsoniomyces obsoletus]|nr:MAG: hypothetical protein M1823_002303 [Watsoniomyces obsoletus]
MHFEYISQAVTQGLMSLQVPPADSKSHPEGYHYVPVVFGVLTVLNEDQAWARAGGRPTDDGEPLVQEQGQGQGHDTNHGIEWAKVAVEMGLLKAYGYS